jgi:hypothetical protein
MAFILHSTNGKKNFPDEARWRISEKGLLEIHTSDRKRFTYSPSGWFFIEEQVSEAGAAPLITTTPEVFSDDEPPRPGARF